MSNQLQIAVFGGGCFWCTEAIFNELRGVESVTPGYAGGNTEDPSYEDVCGGNTGHAEVIQIEFNPDQISFHDLLTVFFATHDPTTPNQQGSDVGTQYRSMILYTSEDQRLAAEGFIEDLNNSTAEGDQIVTELKPLEKFYPAEHYHQKYYENNSNKPYCQIVINPKLQKLQEKFSQLLKE